jgi:ABC-2 type transport system ATP-binding protein
MITMNAVTFGYGGRPLFEDLSLSLKPGTCYGLLGLNGAGKTSLLKLAAGALLPSGGSIEAFGREPGKRSAAHLADLCFVPEDPLAPEMTVDRWLARIALFRPAFDAQQFSDLLREFSLDGKGKISTWSYGQRKKFAIAAAIASGARLLLLDEPTNGLDIPGKTQFRRVLSSMLDADKVIVVSTHQVRDLENLMDPIVVVDQGHVVFEVTIDALAATLSSVRLPDLAGRPVVAARRDALGWHALVAEPGPALDIELLFEAAIASPDRLAVAMAGRDLAAFDPQEALA